jgi:hypothetical protein
MANQQGLQKIALFPDLTKFPKRDFILTNAMLKSIYLSECFAQNISLNILKEEISVKTET